MSLTFEPLAWIYHDGWSFKETYSKPIDEKRSQDLTQTFYQMGHCHLFIPGFDVSQQGSSLAYSGEQVYKFNVVDEWGPSSNNVNVNKSVMLKGKPLWYFYVEEYWRRMYIQNWDKVDNTVLQKYPLNKSVEYDKYNYNQYLGTLVTDIDDMLEKNATSSLNLSYLLYENQTYYDCNWYPLDYLNGSQYGDQNKAYYFSEYITVLRRAAARKEWLKANKENLKENLRTFNFYYYYYDNFEEFFKVIEDKINDIDLCRFILQYRQLENGSNWNYQDEFQDFYKNKINDYNGWYDKNIAMQSYIENIYISENSYSDFDSQNSFKKLLNKKLLDKINNFYEKNYKIDINNNIYIQRDKATGHIGIKYDASNEKHSLGPFREGGDFYFFNTVVNRTMPCEYWLDVEKNSRDYYLKTNDQDSSSTSTEYVWKKDGNNDCFIWVENTFTETNNQVTTRDTSGELTKKTLVGQAGWGDYYEDHLDHWDPGWHGDHYNRRRKDGGLSGETCSAHQMPQNAKRLRTDKYLYLTNPKIGLNNENFGWIGRNDKVILVAENGERLRWEEPSRGWTGWYEYNEIIKCVKDNKYYKRVWKPQKYKIEDPYDSQYPVKYNYWAGGELYPFTINDPYNNIYSIDVEITEDNNYPHWSRRKRQAFPNPPPYLCNTSTEILKNLDATHDWLIEENKKYFNSRIKDWAKKAVYEGSEDNRIHLLHWEYCHYFNLLKLNNTLDYVYRFNTGKSFQYYTRDVTDETWWDENDDYEYSYFNYREKYTPYLNYEKKIIYCWWESAIAGFINENERLPNIEEENIIFEEFINNLPDTEISISSGDYYDDGWGYYMGMSPNIYKDYYRYFTIVNSNDSNPRLIIKEIYESDIEASEQAKRDKETLLEYIRKYCNNSLITEETIPEEIINSNDESLMNNYEEIAKLKLYYNYISNSYENSQLRINTLLEYINRKIITREIKKYYWVNEDRSGSFNDTYGPTYQGQEGIDYSLSYISFGDFCNIWKYEGNVNFDGDMPHRNKIAFPPFEESSITNDIIDYIYKNNIDDIFNRLRLETNPKIKGIVNESSSSSSSSLLDEETEKLNFIRTEVIKAFNLIWGLQEDELPDENGNYWQGGEKEFKCKALITAISKAFDDTPYLPLVMPFNPRIDTVTRAENSARMMSKPPAPPFRLSKLDNYDEYGESLQPVCPYEVKDLYSGETIYTNPINEWKKYFNRREIYTIPDDNIVLGDSGTSAKIRTGINEPSSSSDQELENIIEASQEETVYQTIPMHPRAASYTHEDGARRFYPNDKYITPIIEYQKIIRLNWQRLPKYKKEEEKYKFNPEFTNKAQIDNAPWRLDPNCNWGDGFEVEVRIPFTINGEIQSPFSGADRITLAPGKGGDDGYAHDCVKQENKLRYKIDFYDSLDKVRIYDYPGYIRIIHSFQEKYMPSSSSSELNENDSSSSEDTWEHYNQSLYKENFNDIEATKKYREKETDEIFSSSGIQGYEQHLTWNDLLNEYWKWLNNGETKEIDEISFESIQDNPIVRNYDCFRREIKENAFQMVDNKLFWRQQSTHLLPTIDQVAYTELSDGTKVLGYKDSQGNIRKGGTVVKFNTQDNLSQDGKWVEQCLGAVVKAKCVQIMQDRLGYRYQVVVSETAMTPEGTIKGEDYKG